MHFYGSSPSSYADCSGGNHYGSSLETCIDSGKMLGEYSSTSSREAGNPNTDGELMDQFVPESLSSNCPLELESQSDHSTELAQPQSPVSGDLASHSPSSVHHFDLTHSVGLLRRAKSLDQSPELMHAHSIASVNGSSPVFESSLLTRDSVDDETEQLSALDASYVKYSNQPHHQMSSPISACLLAVSEASEWHHTVDFGDNCTNQVVSKCIFIFA